MSVKLSDSLTMKFNIKYTGGRTLRSAAVPTWNKAAFGHYGYAGFPEGTKPALYQRTGSYNTESTVELTDIKIVNADGSEITGNYSFMMADARARTTMRVSRSLLQTRSSKWPSSRNRVMPTTRIMRSVFRRSPLTTRP